jgi:hypothetical protein
MMRAVTSTTTIAANPAKRPGVIAADTPRDCAGRSAPICRLIEPLLLSPMLRDPLVAHRAELVDVDTTCDTTDRHGGDDSHEYSRHGYPQ